jgi:TolA-binding protein
MAAVVAVLLTCGGGGGGRTASAQEAPNPEQLRKMYDDAVGELRKLQGRINQLSGENEKLTAEVAQMKKQMADMQARMDEMKRTDAEHAEKTFFLRSHYAAWQAFIHQNPDLKVQWKVFLGNDALSRPKALPDGIEPKWPAWSSEEAEG